MCLAIPARIVRVEAEAEAALVSVEGVQSRVSLSLVDGVAEGDYVIVHVGYAIARLDPVEAEKTLALLAAT